MILIGQFEVLGWDHAIRGMRNPLNSWNKSDSEYQAGNWCDVIFTIGEDDLRLMQRLRNAGTDHRKFMRMLTVYVDITAPIYWWKEFDTYKVGTVANSCSTMHTIHKTGIVPELFSLDNKNREVRVLTDDQMDIVTDYLCMLEELRSQCKSGDEQWRKLIQLLPCGFNQKRTVMMNYEVLANMYKSRKDHRLDEWRDFCGWIKELPHSELITGEEDI